MPRYNKQRKAAVDAVVKKDIYQAVMRILAEKQPENLTMERVAEEAGMAKGTLYDYFKNKAELILHVVQSIGRPYEERVKQVFSSNLSIPKKLLKIAELNLLISSKHGEMLDSIAKCASQSFAKSFTEEKTVEARRQGEKRLAMLIEEGVRSGIFRNMPTSDIIILYSALIDGFAKKLWAKKSDKTAAEEAKMLMKLFMNGVST